MAQRTVDVEVSEEDMRKAFDKVVVVAMVVVMLLLMMMVNLMLMLMMMVVVTVAMQEMLRLTFAAA